MSGFSQPIGHLIAAPSNGAANAGDVGEVLSANAAGVSLVTATAKTVTSKLFTPGDWLISGAMKWRYGATTSTTLLIASLSLVDNTLDSSIDRATMLDYAAGIVPGNFHDVAIPTPIAHFNFAASTTVYLVSYQAFSADTLSASGIIQGWRPR